MAYGSIASRIAIDQGQQTAEFLADPTQPDETRRDVGRTLSDVVAVLSDLVQRRGIAFWRQKTTSV